MHFVYETGEELVKCTEMTEDRVSRMWTGPDAGESDITRMCHCGVHATASGTISPTVRPTMLPRCVAATARTQLRLSQGGVSILIILVRYQTAISTTDTRQQFQLKDPKSFRILVKLRDDATSLSQGCGVLISLWDSDCRT